MKDIRNQIAALEEQVRKLKILDELLADPLIASVAKDQLLKQVDAKVAARPHARETTTRPRRRRGPKRQLKKRALEIVKKSTEMLTAKEVADQLEKEGFAFKAKDKTVAVSKALRSLADENEVQALPGEKSKSAIRYSAPPSLLNLPVQEMTTH